MDPTFIPTLTAAVSAALLTGDERPVVASLSADERLELQTRLASLSYTLVERLLYEAYKNLAATLLDEVVGRLRQELPNLIDQVLREQLATGQKEG